MTRAHSLGGILRDGPTFVSAKGYQGWIDSAHCPACRVDVGKQVRRLIADQTQVYRCKCGWDGTFRQMLVLRAEKPSGLMP